MKKSRKKYQNKKPLPVDMLKVAVAARKMAYSPYSGFKVGASVQDDTGRIHSGCNVENATYGATVCAERNAIAAMVAAGGKSIREVVVVTPQGWLPCGICRQVMTEFATNPKKVLVHIATPGGGIKKTFTLTGLLPAAFSLKDSG